ncbi:MAG TPA: hypothetical protein VH437_03270 [Terriglobales bacterium]|jgi:hypothetical protein
MNHNWPWAVLFMLGAYHGVNPAMGWLFALALGLQEKRRSALLRALIPIALGHAAAIGSAVIILRFAQDFVPISIIKLVVATVLFSLGAYRIFRASHPQGSGMRVGPSDLFLWSFLMASAHGAGLMLLPVLLAAPMPMSHTTFSPRSMAWSKPAIALALTIHTLGMLIVAGILACAFFAAYEKWGLRLLQRVWLNFDLVWAVALIVAGVITLAT